MIKQFELDKKYKFMPISGNAYKECIFHVVKCDKDGTYGDVTNPEKAGNYPLKSVRMAWDTIPPDPKYWEEVIEEVIKDDVETPSKYTPRTYEQMMQAHLKREGIETCVQCKKSPATTKSAKCQECFDKTVKSATTGTYRKHISGTAWSPREIDMDIPDV